MEAGTDVWNLISARQDRLERVLDRHSEELEEIPTLRKEVALLTKAVDRNTAALYTVVGTVVAMAVLVVFFGPMP